MNIFDYNQESISKGFWESHKVFANSTSSFLSLEGSGIINRIWLSTFPIDTKQDNELANQLAIKIYWDNSPKAAVFVPLADFFCQPLKLQALKNHFFNSTSDQLVLNTEIPMPFRKKARFDLVNFSNKDIEFFYGVDVEFKKIEASAMYLHSYWKRYVDWNPDSNIEILPQIKGSGKYLGTHISLKQNKVLNNWPWYTRPISLFIDRKNNDQKPSLHINTIDDFFGSAWWDREKEHNIYTFPYVGRSLAKLDDNQNLSIVMYRYHVLDPIWFHRSIDFIIGKNWNWQNQDIGNGEWAITSFFYLNNPNNELPEFKK